MDDDGTIDNALITGTSLTRERGFMTSYLYLEGDGWGCGFGGMVLTSNRHEMGCNYGMEFVEAILETLEKEKWEDLPGTHCRARTRGAGSSIDVIGHIIKDQWFDKVAFTAPYRKIIEASAREQGISV